MKKWLEATIVPADLTVWADSVIVMGMGLEMV